MGDGGFAGERASYYCYLFVYRKELILPKGK